MTSGEAKPMRLVPPAVGAAPDTTAPNTAVSNSEAQAPSSCVANRLRHGVTGGDPRSAPRCGARTRAGGSCAGPAVRGRARCRLHGGRSTGPKTPDGKARASHRKHGGYDARMAELFAEARRLRAEAAALVARHAERQRKLRAAATPSTPADGDPNNGR